MSIAVLTHFFIYCILNAFTPGPGNILAFHTVSSYGVKKGMPLFLGIFSGYFVVQLCCAVVVYAVTSSLPSALIYLKYIGAIYILWLIYHIIKSKPEDSKKEYSASFMKGFVLQLINIKIYLFGITALTGYLSQYHPNIFVFLFYGIVIACFGTLATTTWITLGIILNNIYCKHYKVINFILAILLLECVWQMLLV